MPEQSVTVPERPLAMSLAQKLRRASGDEAKEECEQLRAQLATVHAHVKEALDLLGVDTSLAGYVPDSWTLREQCKIAGEEIERLRETHGAHPIMDRCEYNPVLHQAAFDPPLATDCRNEATVSVGRGKWHLCESCAALPDFKRFKVRNTLKEQPCPAPVK